MDNKIAEMAMTRVSDAVDSLYDDENFVSAAVGAKATDLVLQAIAKCEAKCAAVVVSMPLFNNKTRENRKWLPTQAYGLPLEAQALIRVAGGIQYSAAEHKQMMLATTSLNEVIINMVLDSLGSLPYYNRNYMTVVEGKPTDSKKLAQSLKLMAAQLGVTLDTSAICDNSMDARYTVAKLRAEKSEAEAMKASITSEGKVII